MKARPYIEQQYLPWILFLDRGDTLKHFKDGKENYLCELYNHISEEFKALEHYELYMFRQTATKMMSPYGMINFIIIKTPDVKSVGDSSMIVIGYNEIELSYYYLEYAFENTYSLKEIKNGKKNIIRIFDNPDSNLVLQEIKNLFMN